jgi:hypothetical protein
MTELIPLVTNLFYVLIKSVGRSVDRTVWETIQLKGDVFFDSSAQRTKHNKIPIFCLVPTGKELTCECRSRPVCNSRDSVVCALHWALRAQWVKKIPFKRQSPRLWCPYPPLKAIGICSTWPCPEGHPKHLPGLFQTAVAPMSCALGNKNRDTAVAESRGNCPASGAGSTLRATR